MASEFFAPLPPDAPPEKIPFLVTSSGANASPGPGGLSVRSNILDDVPKTYLKGRTSSNLEVNQAPYRNIGTTIGKGKKFTLKGRTEEHIETNTVAPEYIPPPFGEDARKVTLHGRTPDAEIEITPGPGQYRDNYSIGKDARKATMHGPHDRSNPIRNDSPGPGAYKPQMPPNKPSTRNIRIGHRIETKTVNDIPGPGQYKVKSTINIDKNHGVIRERWKHEHINLNPSPADYDTQRPILEHVTKISLKGRSSRTVEVNQAPFRDTRRSLSETPRYSMRSRYNTAPVDPTPAPEYIPPPFGKDCHRISISPRSKGKEIETSPGPGQYQPHSSKDFGKSRKATFHGPRKRSVDPHTDSPGPGGYYPDYRPTVESSPRFTMKGAKYQEKRDQSGGYVALPSTLRGPRFTFKGRPKLSVSYG
ncbi:Outer dense fiber protein 3-like protein 2 [Tritrichomonas musculus]|uniref:Outer dense fiber protein 3-like protein 2 n=1 Tax=Tritrichomonas musculus TaxID=1915356 RepID=A0ABR2KUE4_9EUKA